MNILTDEQLALACGGLGDTNHNTAANAIAATATSNNTASANQTNLVLNSVLTGVTLGGASINQSSLTAQEIQPTILQLNS